MEGRADVAGASSEAEMTTLLLLGSDPATRGQLPTILDGLQGLDLLLETEDWSDCGGEFLEETVEVLQRRECRLEAWRMAGDGVVLVLRGEECLCADRHTVELATDWAHLEVAPTWISGRTPGGRIDHWTIWTEPPDETSDLEQLMAEAVVIGAPGAPPHAAETERANLHPHDDA